MSSVSCEMVVYNDTFVSEPLPMPGHRVLNLKTSFMEHHQDTAMSSGVSVLCGQIGN